MKEQRKAYRVSNEETDQVEIRLVGLESAAGKTFQGRVVDLSATGVGVEFPPSVDLALGTNTAQRLEVRYWKLEKPVEIEVAVVTKRESEHGHRYGFRFIESADFGEQFQLFNRRSAFRVEPDPDVPIDVWLQHLSGDARVAADESAKLNLRLGDKEVQARLVDISVDGLSAHVEGTAVALEVGGSLALRLTFPTDSEVARFEARVARVQEGDVGVSLGVSFDEEATERFGEQQAIVQRYVMSRQRELLRRLREQVA